MQVKPYNTNNDKKHEVELMFDNISSKYDMLNHLLSFNIDKIWRRKVRKLIANYNHNSILDIATGTGDLAIELTKLNNVNKINALDLSQKMLDVANIKILKNKLENIISTIKGDSENLSFDDGVFDIVTVAFGVRNFQNIDKGINEINRVLKNDGKLIILEFSSEQKFPIKQIYNFYFFKILPFIGKMISKDKSAYTYLPDSVNNFPKNDEFSKIVLSNGFQHIKVRRLTFGIANIFICEK